MIYPLFSGTVSLVPLNGGIPTVVPVTFMSVGDTTTEAGLRLKQSSITVTHQSGIAASPPVQTVEVVTNVGSRLYSARTTTSWIRLSAPFSPTPAFSILDVTPSEFYVGTEPAGLVPGTYIGVVDVASPGIPTIQLPVSLTVTTNPALNAQPSSIILDSVDQTTASLSITSTGGSNLAFAASATSIGDWLSVTPTAGTTGSGVQIVNLRANTTGLGVGIHTGAVSITSPNSPTLNVPVRINVKPGAARMPLRFRRSESNRASRLK